jgi:hypothetical protein
MTITPQIPWEYHKDIHKKTVIIIMRKHKRRTT